MFRRQVACFRNPRHFASSVDRVLDTTVRAGFSGIRLCRAFVALLSEVYCRRLVRLCRNRQTTVERQESHNDLQFSHDLQKHILSSCWWWHWISYPWTIHTITHLSLSLWILLLRIICCHSQTAIFAKYQYLISITFPHLNSTFSKPFLFLLFLMNLIFFSLFRCYHTSWVHHHWWL